MSASRGAGWTGLMLILIGVFLLLYNFDLLSGNIWRLWPVILILWGLKKIFYTKE